MNNKFVVGAIVNLHICWQFANILFKTPEMRDRDCLRYFFQSKYLLKINDLQ